MKPCYFYFILFWDLDRFIVVGQGIIFGELESVSYHLHKSIHLNFWNFKVCRPCQNKLLLLSLFFYFDSWEQSFEPFVNLPTLTLGNVIDPTQNIKKPSLSPKLSPLDKSIIQVQSNWSYNRFTLNTLTFTIVYIGNRYRAWEES